MFNQLVDALFSLLAVALLATGCSNFVLLMLSPLSLLGSVVYSVIGLILLFEHSKLFIYIIVEYVIPPSLYVLLYEKSIMDLILPNIASLLSNNSISYVETVHSTQYASASTLNEHEIMHLLYALPLLPDSIDRFIYTKGIIQLLPEVIQSRMNKLRDCYIMRRKKVQNNVQNNVQNKPLMRIPSGLLVENEGSYGGFVLNELHRREQRDDWHYAPYDNVHDEEYLLDHVGESVDGNVQTDEDTEDSQLGSNENSEGVHPDEAMNVVASPPNEPSNEATEALHTNARNLSMDEKNEVFLRISAKIAYKHLKSVSSAVSAKTIQFLEYVASGGGLEDSLLVNTVLLGGLINVVGYIVYTYCHCRSTKLVEFPSKIFHMSASKPKTPTFVIPVDTSILGVVSHALLQYVPHSLIDKVVGIATPLYTLIKTRNEACFRNWIGDVKCNLQSATELVVHGTTYVGLVVSKNISNLGGLGFISACVMLMVRHRLVLPTVLYKHFTNWLDTIMWNSEKDNLSSEQGNETAQVSDVDAQKVNNRYGVISKSAASIYGKIRSQIVRFIKLYYRNNDAFVVSGSYYVIYASLLSVILTYIAANRYNLQFEKLGWLQKCFYRKLYMSGLTKRT